MDLYMKGDDVLIVEGLDNTGKTTLVEQLQQEFPVFQMRPSIGNKHDLNLIRNQAYEESIMPHPYMLADRARLISEYVYNPILNNRPIAYSFSAWMDMIANFAQGGPHLIIYMRRDVQGIINSFKDREQLEGVEGSLTHLSLAYSKIMGMIELMFSVQRDPMKNQVMQWRLEYGLEALLPYVNDYIRRVS